MFTEAAKKQTAFADIAARNSNISIYVYPFAHLVYIDLAFWLAMSIDFVIAFDSASSALNLPIQP